MPKLRVSRFWFPAGKLQAPASISVLLTAVGAFFCRCHFFLHECLCYKFWIVGPHQGTPLMRLHPTSGRHLQCERRISAMVSVQKFRPAQLLWGRKPGTPRMRPSPHAESSSSKWLPTRRATPRRFTPFSSTISNSGRIG